MNIAYDTQYEPFHHGKWSNATEAWEHALNEDFWRHGITINQGLGWNVTEEAAIERLTYIRARLVRRIFGNSWRRRGATIKFMVFRQGSKRSFNQHFHVLMGIEGNHDWTDEQIASAINEIDRQRRNRQEWEKAVHVDFDWIKGNNFHGYVGRELKFDPDSFFIM